MGSMGRWLTVAPPGSSEALIMLGDAAAFEKTDRVGEFAPCTLECDDAEATRAELAERGVTVTDVEAAFWGTFFYASDQDGNRFLVRQADGD
jgi:predicted enzyme related to lactoylglutathione lyase